MAERIRNFDWSRHPLGPPEQWPQSLRTIVRTMLRSRFQMWLGWGPEMFFFCNDDYIPTLGIKEPYVLGVPFNQVRPEIADDLRPRIDRVMRQEEGTWDEGLLLFLERSGFPEETYHTFSYSPIPDDSGAIGGLLCVVAEETNRVISERRMSILRELATALGGAQAEEEVTAAFETVAAHRPQDYPFALTYLFSPDESEARLVSAFGTSRGSALAPSRLVLTDPESVWPAAAILRQPELAVLPSGLESFSDLPIAPWDRPPREAVVVPLAHQAQNTPAGFMVVGLNPYRRFDAAYRGFLELLGGQLAGALANVRAYAAERRRAEALAELDRAKTAFFSNVSHELRTPLTLMLGPLEDTLNDPGTRSAAELRANAAMAHRNGLRLLKMVNTLLDFARIEVGRMQSSFARVDLAKLTAELASHFQSEMLRAGLRFIVDCPPLSQPIEVDPDQWEKIILNLLSNAFKYTLQGEVRLTLREDAASVQVAISDTGSGIPAEAIPHLFERFYRVEGARGRSQEGTGIGLALVSDLVKLHGGRMTVDSTLGRGSVFTVILPKARHEAADSPVAPVPGNTRVGARAFVNEANRWLPEGILPGDEPAPAAAVAEGQRPSVLLADDNADMRDYVARLLSRQFAVRTVADGEEALAVLSDWTPDLVLSDVMMPKMDGFALLRALRTDERWQSIPIILLSARAGEEARIEGVARGADDYLIKPFSARELVARVSAHIELSRLRKEANFKIQEILRSQADELERQVAERTAKLRDTIGELEAFSYSISHDMRAPLRSMQGYAKALLAEFGPKLDETGVHYLNRIWKNAERLDLLVRDVLAYSKVAKEEVDLTPVDLDVFLPSLALTLTESAQSGLKLELRRPLPVVVAHEAYLSQIFSNLVGNAIKFARPGVPPRVSVWSEGRIDGWKITIEDNGIGINAEHFGRIFEMFGRVHPDNAYEGTGIGLAIVKKAVLRMGGEIGVESTVGSGSRFWFTLRHI